MHVLHYPPPPIEQNIPISPPMKHPWYIQEASECTDVWLRDNPALAEEWRTLQDKAFLPSQPSKLITPLLQIETSCSMTLEISNSSQQISPLVTPLLGLDHFSCPNIRGVSSVNKKNDNTSCKSIPSLLGLNLTPTCICTTSS